MHGELLRALNELRIAQMKIIKRTNGGAKIELTGYIDEKQMKLVQQVLTKYEKTGGQNG